MHALNKPDPFVHIQGGSCALAMCRAFFSARNFACPNVWAANKKKSAVKKPKKCMACLRFSSIWRACRRIWSQIHNHVATKLKPFLKHVPSFFLDRLPVNRAPLSTVCHLKILFFVTSWVQHFWTKNLS